MENNETERSIAHALISDCAKANRRLWVLVLVLILCLFASNMAWLYVFQSYDYTSTVTVDGGDGEGTTIYQDGEGNCINGENCKEDNPDKAGK